MNARSISLWAPAAFALAVLAAHPALSAEPPRASDADVIEYRLRPGDSLTDVARTFRITVSELMQANGLREANTLSVGQLIRVPNAWVRQAGELRKERDDLAADQKVLERRLAEDQSALSSLQAAVDRSEAEKGSLARQVAATIHWQRGAKLLIALFTLLLAGAVALKADRARLARKVRLLAEENGALKVAKEKYRQAASQFDLRYQMLVRGRYEDPKPYLAEGTTILRRVFAEGEAAIEGRLAEIRAEREREQSDEHRSLSALLHRFRALLEPGVRALLERARVHAP